MGATGVAATKPTELMVLGEVVRVQAIIERLDNNAFMASHPYSGQQRRQFETTHWSLVFAASDGENQKSGEALAALCRIYWHPLYAYARSQTQDAHHAEDATQDFFARLLEGKLISHADPARGRFRCFLLSSFKNFLANARDRNQAKKRGGGRTIFSLDTGAAESRYQVLASDDLSPEQIFEKQWVLCLLDFVLERLRSDCVTAADEEFEMLKDFITGVPVNLSYAEAAQRLGKSENATRVAVHRLRKKYRQVLREEIARTIEDQGDVDREIRELFSTWG